MDNSFASARTPVANLAMVIPVAKRAGARVAFIDLKDPASHVLADCFRQFGVETVAMTGDVTSRLQREKFDACVLRLAFCDRS